MKSLDRRIISLALPALGSLAVEPLYVLVDTAIVGRLGTAQLGGLALAATVLSFVVAGCNFLTYGTTERVARRLGAGRTVEAADVGIQATWLSVIVGVVLAPVVALVAPVVGRVLGGEGEILDYAVTYLRIGAVGVPFIVFALAAQGVQRGAADYRTPLVILLSSNLVNVVLELLFVFGFEWGVAGSAWSTVIAQVGAGIAFAIVLRAAPRAGRPTPAEPGRDGARCWPPGGTCCCASGRCSPCSAEPRRSPPASTSRRWPPTRSPPASCCSSPWPSMPSPSPPRPWWPRSWDGSRSSTPRRSAGAWRGCRSSSGAVLAVAVGVTAPLLPHAFTGDDAVADRATGALVWLAVMLVPAAIAFAYDGVLIGAGDYRFLGWAALAYLAAVTPLGLLVLPTGAGIGGIWATLAVWMVLRAVVNHLRAGRLLSTDRASSLPTPAH